jgi:PAS domain S-box-containing protein
MRHGLFDAASLQRMLYNALDLSDDIVLILEQSDDNGEDLVIASANDAFCRTTGQTHAELIGKPFAALIAAGSDPSHWAEIMRAAGLRSSVRTELLCMRKNGSPFWFGLHVMPACTPSSKCFVVLGRDITESMQARQQQAAVQGLLAKVFQRVNAPVAIVSEAGIIQMSNPAMDELLGYPPGRLVGKSSMDCVRPDHRSALITAREKQHQDGRDYTLATYLLRADGLAVPVELSSAIVQREDLRQFRIVTVFRRQEAASTVHVAGKIRLIGLEEVKQALGPRWTDVAARATATAEHVVKRRCGSRDTYSRTSDGGLLICFAEGTEEEAAFRAAAMAREIRNRLIGEGATEASANVSAVTAAVEVPHVPGQSPDMLATVIAERLNSRLAQIEAKARETLRQAVNTATCQLEAVRSRRSRDIIAYVARLPRQQEESILAAYSSLPMQDRQEFDFDRLVLGVAADAIVTELARGESQLVLVNVDFEVFLHRQRTERYVAACQALDNRLRERLILVLTGIPHGFPSSRMLDCVMRLRPFCHSVGFQSDSMEAPPIDQSLLGTAMVVLAADGRSLLDAAQLAKLAKLVDGLHAHHARVMVRHVDSWKDATLLARVGVDLLTMAEDAGGA